MSIDPYSPCPAGTGKKLKFCCADLIGEIENIHRMLEGDQRLACLEHIDRLQAKYPGRACLLTTKALLELELGRPEEARKSVAAVLEQAPTNPVALAELALLAVQRSGAVAGIEPLQQAIAASGSPMPDVVVQALGALAQSLLMAGVYSAARGHYLLLASLTQQDERVLSTLMRLSASPQIPLLMKEDPNLQTGPEGFPWKDRLAEALVPVGRGAWQVAVNKLVSLTEVAPDAAAAWRNLATLRSWLADDEGAAEALRKLPKLDVSRDDKVEAEALAQLLDPESTCAQIESVTATFPIFDVEKLTERLADRRVMRININPAAWPEADEPPPRSAYLLLSLPMPRASEGLTPESVPVMLGQMLLYGRQTDREARLEVTFDRPDEAAARAVVTEVCGELVRPASGEEVEPGAQADLWALEWKGRLPEDATVDVVHKLMSDQQRRAVLDRWTQVSFPPLGGKTPAQAAGDSTLEIPLAALVLNLELASQSPAAAGVFEELRQHLKLPVEGLIDPTGVDMDRLPLARLHRLDCPKLTDEQLVMAHQRALFVAARLALYRLSKEITQRESLKDKVGVAQVYGLLGQLEDDSKQGLAYLEQGRVAAKAAGQSTANLELQELAIRIARGEMAEFERVLRVIQTHHIREPGVAQALQRLLIDSGLLTPDGRPAMAGMAAGPAGGAMSEPAAEDAGKIWTPQSESPGQKSSLWIPD
ncbi:MAG TPA: hypothetical protein VGJ26_21855 [Pirellulales bacterium]|jgi:hypothetical protein